MYAAFDKSLFIEIAIRLKPIENRLDLLGCRHLNT